MNNKIECPKGFGIPTVDINVGCSGFSSIQECQDCKVFVGKRINLSSLTPEERRKLEIADSEDD
jgi:hypothetical protein